MNRSATRDWDVVEGATSLRSSLDGNPVVASPKPGVYPSVVASSQVTHVVIGVRLHDNDVRSKTSLHPCK